MTFGGGWGVVTADLCSDYHLEVPALPADLTAEFDRILPSYWSRSNPVDIVGEMNDAVALTVLETLLRWKGCDAVINLGILGRRILLDRLVDSVLQSDPTCSRDWLASARKSFAAFEEKYLRFIVSLMEKYDKPVFGVSMLTENGEQTVHPVSGSRYQAVVYTSPERAVKAFAKMAVYNRTKQAGP